MVKFCSLYSGSSGNAVLIVHKNTRLLIDAGLSAKKIVEGLQSIGEDPGSLTGILISHEHSDHIRGAGIMSRKFNLPLYANQKTWEAMEPLISPIDKNNMCYFETGSTFELCDILVKPFSIPHDAAEPVGFNFMMGNKKFTNATDIGHMNKTLLTSFMGSDAILLESNHDEQMLKVGPYPWSLKKRILGNTGHLSNEMAGKTVAYLAQNGTKRFFMGHLSKENNFPELCYQTILNIVTEKEIKIGSDITLDVLRRDCAGEVCCF